MDSYKDGIITPRETDDPFLRPLIDAYEAARREYDEAAAGSCRECYPDDRRCLNDLARRRDQARSALALALLRAGTTAARGDYLYAATGDDDLIRTRIRRAPRKPINGRRPGSQGVVSSEPHG